MKYNRHHDHGHQDPEADEDRPAPRMRSGSAGRRWHRLEDAVARGDRNHPIGMNAASIHPIRMRLAVARARRTVGDAAREESWECSYLVPTAAAQWQTTNWRHSRGFCRSRLALIGVREPERRRDLAAGVGVAAILVPQGMASGQLAGLQPVVGLYSALGAMVAFALVSRTRQLG
jgi:hypothetical protein